MSKQNEGHYSHQPTLQHHSQEDNNAFIIDSKIRITSAEIFEDRGNNKKKTKPVKLSKKPAPIFHITSIALLINNTEIPIAIGTSIFKI